MAKQCTETRDELSTTFNPSKKFMSNACQRLMLHPYIIGSGTSTLN